MGDANRNREAQKRTDEIRRYIDTLTPTQRVALQSELAHRRNAEGNAVLDLEAIKAMVEGMDVTSTPEEDAIMARAYSPRMGERCPCGAKATHRVDVAVWGQGEFKALHRPAIIPVGGVFLCEPHAQAFKPDPTLRETVDEQIKAIGKPARDWSTMQVHPVPLESICKATDLLEPSPTMAICAVTDCGKMASHRAHITAWAIGTAERSLSNCLRAAIDLGLCEHHAATFLDDGNQAEARSRLDQVVAAHGGKPIDWETAECEAVPIPMVGRPN